MEYYIITYDFSSEGIEDVYAELQPKVSEYLINVLQQDQIMNNIWFKKWDEHERNVFIAKYKTELCELLGRDIYNKNFSICVFRVTHCWCHPETIKTKICLKSLFS